MDNPVDHPLDLGLVNYTRHPSNNEYVVFRFPDEARANSFEEELHTQKIWFERSSEEKKQRTYHLFGLHKTDFKKAQDINVRVEGRHKKPFISFAPLRYLIVAFGLIVITLALVGYCKQQQKLASYDDSGVLINDTKKSE